jgi:hypothetical protein
MAVRATTAKAANLHLPEQRSPPKRITMSNKPKKNRSARDKRVAHDRRRRNARRREDHPLYYLQPPFEPYATWMRVPDSAKDIIEYPFTPEADAQLGDGAKDLMNTMVKLGPRYKGAVPMAAFYLDKQIASGTIDLAVAGEPDHYRPVPLSVLAADISSQEHLDEMRRIYPGADLDPEAHLVTDDACGWHLHELHFHGYLIVDDDHLIHMAVPPKEPDGEWQLSGHTDDD